MVIALGSQNLIRYIRSLLIWAVVLIADGARADPAIDDFVRHPYVTDLRLSPSGEFFAALAPHDDQNALLIFHTPTLDFVSGMKLAKGESVLDFQWAGPQEVVAELGSYRGFQDALVATGEVMRLQASKGAVGVSTFNRRTIRDGYVLLVDATPGDPNTVLVDKRMFGSNSIPRYGYLLEWNMATARYREIGLSPEPHCEYVVDYQGDVRLAYCGRADESAALYRLRPASERENDKDLWQQLPNGGAKEIDPLFISRDGRWVYFKARGLPDAKGDGLCLARLSLESLEAMKVLSCQPGADLATVIASADGKELLAAYYESDGPQLDVLDTTHPDLGLLLQFQKHFAGQFALPVSSSRDGRYWLLAVYSDAKPTSYHLYDQTQKSLRKLFDSYPGLANKQLPPKQALKIKARDGWTLPSYLTMPANSAMKKPALIVMPHGGPFGVRDHWEFDAAAQLLAHKGYAVLQVNFRGSSGFGKGHSDAGIKQWGGLMINDILDATKSVLAQGKVDANRVAIFGVSYGGYAALMSAAREPGMFKAVATVAGVVDLETWVEDADFADNSFGKIYVERYVGADPAALKLHSPIQHVKAIKAPIFIAHGEADARVPFNQAKRLRKALKSNNQAHEWVSFPGEGHGLTRMDNRRVLYDKLLKFLAVNLN